MILLDTNVISALMRPTPDDIVIRWMDRQDASELWTTSVTVFEVRFGLALLSESRKKRTLSDAFHAVLTEDLEGRIAEFDGDAANAAAALAAERQHKGRPVDLRDTLIAGIAISRRATLATHNTRHFQDLPITVVDPWTT